MAMQRRLTDSIQNVLYLLGKTKGSNLAFEDFSIYRKPQEEKEASIHEVFAALKGIAKKT
ncbi:hypothetical protein [Gimesia sp.]|uniref:hypothetical protein n=1 Tax=Gimesia sp. TaxID=2024833 RepID=UPI003A95BA45